MALSALLATTSIFRSVPVVASVVVHASVAGALLVSAGHASAGTAKEATAVLESIDVDVAPEAPKPEPAPEREEAPVAKNVASPTPPTHTHPYPVDPSHDARPHDPSVPHEHADHHDHDEPAPAAPVATSESNVLPRFTIPSPVGGSATSTSGGRTSETGTGTGGPSGGGGGGGSAADDAIVSAAAVQVPAKLAQAVVAAYPVDARADEIEGDVQLEIVVDREGRVVEAKVARAAGHGFDDAALAAIRRYRFSPAQRDGHAVRVRMPWSVQFRLR